jgi:hypothetical protein
MGVCVSAIFIPSCLISSGGDILKFEFREFFAPIFS